MQSWYGVLLEPQYYFYSSTRCGPDCGWQKWVMVTVGYVEDWSETSMMTICSCAGVDPGGLWGWSPLPSYLDFTWQCAEDYNELCGLSIVYMIINYVNTLS